MKLDIIIPLYNNEKYIKNYYEEACDLLKNIKYNFIFVDNSSTDNTPGLIKEIYKSDDDHVKIITLSKEFDKNNAILAGLRYSKADLVCIGDVTCSPKYILKLYSFINENIDYDCVCYCNKKKNGLLRKILVKFTSKNTGIKYIDENTNLKIMKRSMLNSVLELANVKGYSNAIYDIIGFNIYRDYTYNGETIKDDLFNYIFNYSIKPLKSLTCLGVFVVLISIIYLVYSLFTTLNKETLLLFLLIFFNGLNLGFLGIIGNYIVKLLNRNCYAKLIIIKEKIGFDENYL